MKFYLVSVKTLSNGTSEERAITPYDDMDVALRKFHEAFNTIGGGPRKICVMLLDQDFGIVKVEVWEQTKEVEVPEEGE